MEPVGSRLINEGYKSAAEASVFQATVRTLPHHNHETLLVYGVKKREVLDRYSGMPLTGRTESHILSPSLSDGGVLASVLGVSKKETASDSCHETPSGSSVLSSALGTSDKEATSCIRQETEKKIGGLKSRPHKTQIHSAVTVDSLVGIPHPTDVSSVNSDTYKREIQSCLYAKYKHGKFSKDAKDADTKIQKALRVQQPDLVTSFKLTGVDSTELLPGGIPVIDHLIAFLDPQPAWQETCGVLKLISKERITYPTGLPDIQELEVGVSTPTQFEEMGKWLDQKHQENKYLYGFCLPALDVECLGLILTNSNDSWTGIKEEMMLTEKVYAKVDGPRLEKATRFNFPVLMMYGGIGWQLHIRIAVNYIRNGNSLFVEIPRMEAETEVMAELFSHFLPAVGTGVKEDIASFVKALNIVNESTLEPDQIPVGIPLDRLAKLSGISHPQSSLVFLTYLVLGGILAKEWKCSVADHQWGRSLDKLGDGLKAYLAGDIQQVTRMACTLLISWVVHIIPDAESISRGVGIDPLRFIAYWLDTVVKNELTYLKGSSQSAPQATNREQLLKGMGIAPNDGSTLVSLCPPWPAITSGGPKNLNETQVFSAKATTLFKSICSIQLPSFQFPLQETVPQLPAPISPLPGSPSVEPVRMAKMPKLSCPFCLVDKWRTRVELKAHIATCGDDEMMETDAVPAAAVPAHAPAISAEDMMGAMKRHPATIGVQDPYFDCPPKDLTNQDLGELARKLEVSQKQVLVEYILRDLDRAVLLLDFMERNKRLAVYAVKLQQGIAIVTSLRIYLHQKARLRETPPGWVDPWKIPVVTDEHRAEYQAHLTQILEANKEKMRKMEERVAKATSLLTAPSQQLPAPMKMPNESAWGEGTSKRARQRRRKTAEKDELNGNPQLGIKRVFFPTPPSTSYGSPPSRRIRDRSPSASRSPPRSRSRHDRARQDRSRRDRSRHDRPWHDHSRHGHSRHSDYRRDHASRQDQTRWRSQSRPAAPRESSPQLSPRTKLKPLRDRLGPSVKPSHPPEHQVSRQLNRPSHHSSSSWNSRGRHLSPQDQRGRHLSRANEQRQRSKSMAARSQPASPARRSSPSRDLRKRSYSSRRKQSSSPQPSVPTRSQPPAPEDESMDTLPSSPRINLEMEEGDVVLDIKEDYNQFMAVKLPGTTPVQWVGPAVQPEADQHSWPELTEEMKEQVTECKEGTEDTLIIRKGLGISKGDIRRTSRQWFNDAIICGYMQKIVERSEEAPPGGLRVHALTTLQTAKLLSQQYTRPDDDGVDIFDYQLVLCPINVEGNHWVLAVIDVDNKLIRYYDSYPHRAEKEAREKTEKQCFDALRHFIQGESIKNKHGVAPVYNTVTYEDTPRQEGAMDCGVFLCMFAEHLTRHAAFNFSQRDVAYWRERIAWELINDTLLT